MSATPSAVIAEFGPTGHSSASLRPCRDHAASSESRLDRFAPWAAAKETGYLAAAGRRDRIDAVDVWSQSQLLDQPAENCQPKIVATIADGRAA